MKLSIFPLLAAVAFAQTQPAPSFQPDRVLFIDHPVPLAPDLILSIFGNNLGPNTGCASFHDAKGIYPKELCDTQVLVGGIPSELLWAQAGQINFRVPSQTPVEGTADLVVVYQGRSSQAVAMPLRVESPTLALDGPARVGMPVWLRLDMPYYRDSGIRYPYNVFPAAFGCNEVEVRRNGVLLPRMADAGTQGFGGIIGPGNPCGGIGPSGNPRFHGRLPLHLQYRFDQPGTYEVRLTMRRLVRHDVSSVTDWTKIEILPAEPGARSRWLADTVAQINRMHSNDRVYVTLLDHAVQAIVEGEALPAVPLSMANVLEPLKDSQRMQLSGESVVEAGASKETGYALTGSQVLNLVIR